MFTGLVEAAGRVSGIGDGDLARLTVEAAGLASDTEFGDSVAVDGVCLTVNEVDPAAGTLTFYAMPETLRRTALGDLGKGRLVNLERAMSPDSRFGGHIVQGHVDGVGEVLSVEAEGGAEIWEFSAPEAVLRYTIEKGSACVSGISLTVVSVLESSFTVSILPQTKAETSLHELGVGDRVNLEADIIGKYVERLLDARAGRGPGQDNVSYSIERRVEDAV